MENSELLKSAREALSGKWVLAVVTFFVYMAILGAVSAIPGAGSIIGIIIGGPFLLGISLFSISLSRGEEANLEQIFSGFNQFGRTVMAYLLMVAYIILWLLLLIVPGIIKSIAYAMTFYIMVDDNEISGQDAITKSEKMMDGYKMKYFTLALWFFLLGIGCILTLGIGFLWLFPYMYITYAKFYDDVKANYVEVSEANTSSTEDSGSSE